MFPGGRIDRGDEAPATTRARGAPPSREAREEAGLELDPASLVPLSHWTTPEGQPRRFATWFYVAEVGRDEVRIDGGEIHEHRWFCADEALAAQRAGEIELPPPTFVTLATLRGHRSPRSRARGRRAREPLVYLPAHRDAAPTARLALPGRRGLGVARPRGAPARVTGCCSSSRAGATCATRESG